MTQNSSYVVTRHNVHVYSPIILEKIHKASYISVDTEFSGLGDPKLTRLSNIQERYNYLKTLVENHALFSLAFCIVSPDNTYFNVEFMLFKEKEYSVSSSALKFLLKNGFDFNYQIENGISYGGDQSNPISPLVEELVKFKKKIVVHNGLLDLMFLYNYFYLPLPKNLESFVADLYDMFGGVHDTKYVSDYNTREENERHSSRIETPVFLTIEDIYIQEPIAPEIKVKNQLCQSFANHGHCSNERCDLSHNIQQVLDSDENLKHKKIKKDETISHHVMTVGKSSEPHSSMHDAFMTAYVYAYQKFINREDTDFDMDNVNKLYLIGKELPLLVHKSGFSKYSKNHSEKISKLRAQ
ncbi:ribonuclease CAF1 [Rozella allomycis CSF55]|uniref:Ribonuclease CAF1 n=1 Tax=Rozella allomycis (strain CSF55) TaxID=988480 RepID=A0A075ARZ8_ROZAC|nr:Ribonuclease CAF1 domain-containing protein [Rozella allomycis CSF55]RKP20190.1 ribonuclease CAF1 [Rozella allomycis CSF55]|eukprot:EPZ31318.1 Ribonuclease CAF1 domain-containing protein [Rozella allomycis CSF55]